MTSSEYQHGKPLANPPSAKYRRAAVTLQLGVPETWMDDGSEARIVQAIERLFNSMESGVGPGGSILQSMFVLSWKPGDVARLPSGQPIEPLLEKWRREYPLRPAQRAEMRTEPMYEPLRNPLATSEREDQPDWDKPVDMHEPPGYPSRSLEWGESQG